MDVSIYAVLALLALCRLGCGSPDLDTIVDENSEDFKQNGENIRRSVFNPVKREIAGAFPDQKFRHLGLGKRTLDFFRFYSKVGKRLDLLALIQNNLDKSQKILTGNAGTYDNERLPLNFGTRGAPIRRSLRNRKNALRMSQKGAIGKARGRRQKVDPYMYLIGVGK